MLRGTAGGVGIGTTAAEVCSLASPYNPEALQTAELVAGSTPRYVGRGALFTDSTNARLALGISSLIPSNDFTTYTDHDAVAPTQDTDFPGTEFYSAWGRGTANDVAAVSSWYGNVPVELYQKAFAATTWTPAHTFPTGTEGMEAALFDVGGGELLCWLPGYPGYGYGDYAYSTDDGVSWTDQNIDANVDHVYAMAEDGGGTYYAIVSNSVSGDIEVWSAAAVGGPWAFAATVAAYDGDSRGIIDIANTTMFVYVNQDIYSAPSPYTVWTLVGSTTGSFAQGFIRAGTAGRLAIAFFNTLEESADGGATWTVQSTGIVANEYHQQLFADNRAAASQEAVLLLSSGRYVTGPMTLGAWSAPAVPAGAGNRLAIAGVGWDSANNIGLYLLGAMPLDGTREAVYPNHIRGFYSNCVAYAVDVVGVGAFNQGFHLDVSTRNLQVFECIRPASTDRGAFAGLGDTAIITTDAGMTAATVSNPTIVGDTHYYATNAGIFVAIDNSLGDVYITADGAMWSAVTGLTNLFASNSIGNPA
jgi:hypothetical protein